MPKKRKRFVKSLKPVLHIFCEGKTEEVYVKQYKSIFCASNKRIQIHPTEKNTPKELVKEASLYQKTSGGPSDIYWVVYDRESHKDYDDSLHKVALDKAERKGINVALSNVCFEVWLLLHFVEGCPAYSSFDDLLKRSDLKKYIPDYQKGFSKMNECFLNKCIAKAVKTAKRINMATLEGAGSGKDKPYQLNPYTNMYELLYAMDDLLKTD